MELDMGMAKPNSEAAASLARTASPARVEAVSGHLPNPIFFSIIPTPPKIEIAPVSAGCRAAVLSFGKLIG